MEENPEVDIAAILATVQSAEVFMVRFKLFERFLLVDTRAAENDPPLIVVANPVRFLDERYREMRRRRPNLPVPNDIVHIEAPLSVRTLVQSGIWEAIKQRLVGSGAAEATCQDVLAELQKEERTQEVRAVIGDRPYRTLASGR
jgi:hypothetical protein